MEYKSLGLRPQSWPGRSGSTGCRWATRRCQKWTTTPAPVRAHAGRLSALRVFHSESAVHGAFVWARRARDSTKRRFPARAVYQPDASNRRICTFGVHRPADLNESWSPENNVRAIIIVPLYMEDPYRSCYSSSSPRSRRQNANDASFGQLSRDLGVADNQATAVARTAAAAYGSSARLFPALHRSLHESF